MGSSAIEPRGPSDLAHRSNALAERVAADLALQLPRIWLLGNDPTAHASVTEAALLLGLQVETRSPLVECWPELLSDPPAAVVAAADGERQLGSAARVARMAGSAALSLVQGSLQASINPQADLVHVESPDERAAHPAGLSRRLAQAVMLGNYRRHRREVPREPLHHEASPHQGMRLLCVENEPDVGELIGRVCELVRLECEVTYEVEAAVRAMAERPFDVLMTKARIRGGDDENVAEHARRLSAGTVPILVTSAGTWFDPPAGAIALADRLLALPFLIQDFANATQRLLELRRAYVHAEQMGDPLLRYLP